MITVHSNFDEVTRYPYYVTASKPKQIDLCDEFVKTQTLVWSDRNGKTTLNGTYMYETEFGDEIYRGPYTFFGIDEDDNRYDWVTVIRIDSEGLISNTALKNCIGGSKGSKGSGSGSGNGDGLEDAPK